MIPYQPTGEDMDFIRSQDCIHTDLEQAVTAFVNANPGTRKHIYCTYTAMLKTRAVLGRITEVRDAGVGK